MLTGCWPSRHPARCSYRYTIVIHSDRMSDLRLGAPCLNPSLLVLYNTLKSTRPAYARREHGAPRAFRTAAGTERYNRCATKRILTQIPSTPRSVGVASRLWLCAPRAKQPRAARGRDADPTLILPRCWRALLLVQAQRISSPCSASACRASCSS